MRNFTFINTVKENNEYKHIECKFGYGVIQDFLGEYQFNPEEMEDSFEQRKMQRFLEMPEYKKDLIAELLGIKYPEIMITINACLSGTYVPNKDVVEKCISCIAKCVGD